MTRQVFFLLVPVGVAGVILIALPARFRRVFGISSLLEISLTGALLTAPFHRYTGLAGTTPGW